MDLVFYRGAQYPADRLPAGVDLAECVPLDEWFAKNRRNAAQAGTPAELPAKRRTKKKSG